MAFLFSNLSKRKISVFAIVAIVVLVSAGLTYYLIIGRPSLLPSPTPTTSPNPTSSMTPISTLTPTPVEITTQEKIRDEVIDFIKTNHFETAQFMNNIVWTGGRVILQNLVGAETYMYYSLGWNFTITYPVVLNPIYRIIADYSSPSIGVPYRIIWQGTWQNNTITETSYVFAQ